MNERGFTLIELIVTVSIIVLALTFSIPAFKQFTTSQYVKSSVIEVKGDVRSIHNKAINGFKNKNGERVPWTLRFSNGASFYEMFGCPTATSTLGSCKDYLNDYKKIVLQHNQKINICDYPCTTLTAYPGIVLNYSVIDGNVSFYRYDPAAATSYESVLLGISPSTAYTNGKISILLSSTDTTTKSIFTINSNGGLIENVN